MLDTIYFNEYLLQTKSNLYASNPPTFKLNSLLWQFRLMADTYLDQNKYIELDQINIKRSRIIFFESGQDFQAFHIQKGESWSANTSPTFITLTDSSGSK